MIFHLWVRVLGWMLEHPFAVVYALFAIALGLFTVSVFVE